jgi:hypothetical protein
MRDYYPAFSLSFKDANEDQQAVWTGKVQPIRTTERLEDLLDDIHCERPFYVLSGGEVLHHPECEAEHTSHGWAEKLTNPYAVYELEVRHGGGRRHPKVYVRDPVIPEEKRRHMFGDGSICPYAPWQPIWLWEEHTVVDYMGHTLGWLIKWMVWEQVGAWVGLEIDHDPRFLLRNIGSNKPCWCGSGKKYKKCHRASDEESARGKS